MKLGIALSVFLVNCLICSSAGADRLVFVQAVWRHGDRSPTLTFPTDTYQENHWNQGWGQLSPLGMVQHLNLGDRLHQQYVVNNKFLTANYKNHEVYVRSTDVNRTLVSAMSNMVRMFPAVPGDFPANEPRWPSNWVAVPIHTIRDDVDYTLNPDMTCPRQTELWNLVKQSPEYTGLQEKEKEFFDFLTKQTGMSVTPENIWIIADALSIEQANNLRIADWLKPWKSTSQTIYDKINELNNIVEYWYNGLTLAKNGDIDFSIEIPKIRGGSLLWSMIGHMQQKLFCMDKTDFSKNPECQFFSRLKYYAYSAHDTTLAALFSTLGFHMTNWNQDGYPHYSSAVSVELWIKDDGSNYVKFLYWPLDEPVVDVTPSVTNCGSPCTLESLVSRSGPFKPTDGAAALCSTSLKSSASAVFPSLLAVSAAIFAAINPFHTDSG